jgi:hypothetical protein
MRPRDWERKRNRDRERFVEGEMQTGEREPERENPREIEWKRDEAGRGRDPSTQVARFRWPE